MSYPLQDVEELDQRHPPEVEGPIEMI